jgi:hypothetical protein
MPFGPFGSPEAGRIDNRLREVRIGEIEHDRPNRAAQKPTSALSVPPSTWSQNDYRAHSGAPHRPSGLPVGRVVCSVAAAAALT